jgi:hypothetical protein
MLAHGPEILTKAGIAARATPAFTVYTFESIPTVWNAPECLTLSADAPDR